MIGDNKIVDYETWCPKCLYFEKEDFEDPCNECLNEPVNQDSHKPVRFRPSSKENK